MYEWIDSLLDIIRYLTGQLYPKNYAFRFWLKLQEKWEDICFHVDAYFIG